MYVLNFLFTNILEAETNSLFMWNLKDEIKSFLNGMNKFRITIIAVPSLATVLGVLKNHTFLSGFGVGFIAATLMIATVALKYG